jgi:UDP:flavonoid glycosyltransferase YjiC (YdhE family)
MSFSAAPEYHVFPTSERPLKPYEAAVRAARETEPLIRERAPDAVVSDILTLAPALAAEVVGVRLATVIPHVHPATEPGFPPYSLGARLPRTAAGRGLWRAIARPVANGLRRGRDELNGARRRLGLEPVEHFHGGISRDLCLVATFPQLEYPRDWPSNTHLVGPLMWEPPAEDVELPEGEGPLILVAASLEALADLPVRVLATWNRRPPPVPLTVPANARLVEWVSYSRTMPSCDIVMCHGGHGTVARALSNGCAVLACPAAGDMNENAARIDWAGVGVRLPRRYPTARSVRLAAERLLGDPSIAARAREIWEWAERNPGAARAADLVERFARG